MSELSRTIEARRQEMRSLSKKMNGLIDKRMQKTTTSKNRPHFNPEYSSPQLAKLQEELNSHYQQISKAKG